MNSKANIIAVAIAALTLIVLGASMLNGIINKEKLSPNTLYLTQPVNFFTGTVTAVNSNSVTLTKEVPIRAKFQQKTVLKKIAYTVRISSATGFHQNVFPLDYPQKTGAYSQPVTPTIKDIHIGDTVTAHTDSDLRTLTGDTFTATSVDLPPVQKLLSGKISGLTDRSLLLKVPESYPVANGITDFSRPINKARTYEIQVNSLSKFNKYTFVNGLQTEVKKIDYASLHQGMDLTVYVDQDIKNKSLILVLGELSETVNTAAGSSTSSAVLNPIP